MKKKILLGLLVLVGLFTITGCGNEIKKDDSSNSTNSVNEQKSEVNESSTDKSQKASSDYVYMFNTTQRMKVGTEPSKYGTYYSTAEEAMKAYGYDITIRHTLEHGKIKESYVGFKYNGKINYIKGQDTTIYEQNKKLLKEIFDESKCSETKDYFNCYDSSMGVIIRKDGSTEAGINKDYCISYDDFAKCGTH